MLSDVNSHEFLTALRGLERVEGELVKSVTLATKELDKIGDMLRKIDDAIRQFSK